MGFLPHLFSAARVLVKRVVRSRQYRLSHTHSERIEKGYCDIVFLSSILHLAFAFHTQFPGDGNMGQRASIVPMMMQR